MSTTVQAYQPSSARRTGRRWLVALVVLLIAGAALAWSVRGRGYWNGVKRWLTTLVHGTPTSVIAVTPTDRANGIDLVTTIVVQAKGRPIDQDTLGKGIRLIRTHDEVLIPVEAQLSDDGASVTMKPTAPLSPKTKYTILITPDLRDTGNNPVEYFKAAFTTKGNPDPAFAFEKVRLPNAQSIGFTGVVRGDGRQMYACSDDGQIFRFAILNDGTLETPRISDAVKRANGVERLISGICVDPSSTEDHPVLWVAHNHYGFGQVADWGGKISRVSGRDLETVDDVVINLPRSYKDHTTHQPVLGPDGALYFHQGSSSAYGDPDEEWGMRPEHPLSAALLRLDLSKVTPGQPVDVKTPSGGGTYDPDAPGAPLTIYAKGMRVAYDLLWASNGKLYAPVNGSSQGGNLPAGGGAPAIRNLAYTEPDYLYDVEQGKYYGHPNPAQGKYILNGANPTAEIDVAEIPQYPVGIKPDPDWDPPLYDFGAHVSANGIEEYRGNAFGGQMKGRLLVCRYNFGSDLILLTVGGDGSIADAQVGTAGLTDFVNPLDVAEDRATGNLYVAEYGGRRITLLRPVEQTTAPTPAVAPPTLSATDRHGGSQQ